MSWRSALIAKGSILLAAALPMAGCAAAAAAGAGAAGAVYLTSRGAESVVAAPVAEVARSTRKVMSEMQIVPDETTSKEAGDQREFKGKRGDLDVTIKLNRETENTTKVEVTARKSLAEWDKDYAKQVLTRIVQAS